MKLIRLFILSAVLIATFCLAASSQTSEPAKPLIGGVVNGKALTLPKPEYPDTSRKVQITGAVSVQVLIDESGNVVSAKATSGPPDLQLRAAAEAAALKATFSPTTLKGVPVKVSGAIIYNFTASKGNEERLEVMSVSAFLVVVGSSASNLDLIKKVLDEKELIKEDLYQFPRFQAELTPLLSLEKMSVESRIEALAKTLSSIKSRLGESDKWQFEMGKNLGEIMGPFFLMVASGGDHPDVSKIPDAQIKLNLSKIRELTLSAPPDFPADVLQKLKALADLETRSSFKTPENFKDLFDKIGELIEVISPDETK